MNRAATATPRRTPQTLKPLRRKPKQLDEEPTLLVPPSRGTSLIAANRHNPDANRRSGDGGSSPGVHTDEDGELNHDDTEIVTDEATRRRAHRIARKLALAQVIDTTTAPRAATGALATRRWRDNSNDIDLDATLEAIAANPIPADDDFLIRQRIRQRRSIMLVVDISGSARGEQVRTAAATVGALAGALAGTLHRDAVGVIAFWSDAALLSPLTTPTQPDQIIDQLLTLPTRGLTNITFALSVAAQQLHDIPPTHARVLLLSDCIHNAGPDPRVIAATLPRLDVLLDTSNEHDIDLAWDLAQQGRGRCAPIADDRGIPTALRRIFAP
ncbi:hypothetical protein AXA44_27590 [Rhodococcus sp. SC4]|nr:hypothetical protein AXA44_27590 [Rhodococcus sp. SC4]